MSGLQQSCLPRGYTAVKYISLSEALRALRSHLILYRTNINLEGEKRNVLRMAKVGVSFGLFQHIELTQIGMESTARQANIDNNVHCRGQFLMFFYY